MNIKKLFQGGAVFVMVLVLSVGLASANPVGSRALGSGFTYQGQLKSSDVPYTGSCDLQFKLYDSLVSGIQVGSTQTLMSISISEGYFTVVLDFGPAAFNGEARWLEIAVRCPAGSGTYQVLMPRQALTAAPYAWYAQQAGSTPWSGITGMPAGFLDGVDNDTQYLAGTGLTLAGTTFSADTTYMQRRVSGTCATGNAIRLINADGTVTCQAVSGSGGWALTGNAGTSPTTNYLGTSDDVALELRVNGLRALRLEPNATSPNLVGGYLANSVTTGVHGAFIGGGGDSENANAVTDHYGVIGGGADNLAGNSNGNLSDATYATVSGGWVNAASGEMSFVGGGVENTASGYISTVAGGWNNTSEGQYSVVVGGWNNTAKGNYSVVGGGHENKGTKYGATVSGGEHNLASDDFSTISGGQYNLASNWFSIVGGGANNEASGGGSTVSGGSSNTASADSSTVGGGFYNISSGYVSTVGGGLYNISSGSGSTVSGGLYNEARSRGSTVGGGLSNISSGEGSTVPGGAFNFAQGDLSLAAGYRANANNIGCFVWGDSTDENITCAHDNRWVARASGGVYFYSTSNLSTGAYLATGSGTWASVSDRNLKENITPVEPAAVLEALLTVPISSWNYITQDESIRHIGPMAQDFYAAFGVGENETSITTIDADGVALAAIQGLYAENQALKDRVEDLEVRLEALEAGRSSGESAANLPWMMVLGLAVVAGVWVLRRDRGGMR